MEPEEEVKRAGRAREILENELFKEAVSEIEEALKEGRLRAPATDNALRDKLWAQEVALYAIIQKLTTHIETGQLAQQTLLEKAKGIFNG